MNNTFIRPETFSPFDYEGIAEHLEKMAARGWMVEKMRPLFWTYRQIKPARLTFHVSYPFGALPYDPYSAPERSEHRELCGHTGWHSVASWGPAEIFYSSDESPTPVETEPALTVWSIHIAAMKSLLPFDVVAVPCMLLCLFSVLSGAISTPPLLTTFCALAFAQTAVYYTVELVSYLAWYIRASKTAGRGEWTSSPIRSRVLRVMSVMAIGEVVLFSLAAVLTGADAEAKLIALSAVLIFGLFTGTDLMRESLGRLGLSRTQNRGLTALASLAVFTAVSILLHML